jgi:hypothetical protein
VVLLVVLVVLVLVLVLVQVLMGAPVLYEPASLVDAPAPPKPFPPPIRPCSERLARAACC